MRLLLKSAASFVPTSACKLAYNAQRVQPKLALSERRHKDRDFSLSLQTFDVFYSAISKK